MAGRRRGPLVLLGVALAVVLVGLAWPTAALASVDGSPLAVLGLPSVGDLVDGIVDKLFGTFADKLIPDFLRDADTRALKWLVAIPNVAEPGQWQTIGALKTQTTWLAGGMLQSFLIASVTRDLLLGAALRGHPGASLLRFVGILAGLIAYGWLLRWGATFVNTVTNALLSLDLVERGLRRTVTMLFAGGLLTGNGGPFMALIALIAAAMGVVLFLLKVALLLLFALLYVAGPLVIAARQLPGLEHLFSAWLYALGAVAVIPIAWCLLFATAGAMSLDVTSAGGVAGGGGLGDRTAGAFATVVLFALALSVPMTILGAVKGRLAGTMSSARVMRGPAVSSPARQAGSAQAARTRLRVGDLARGAVAAGRHAGQAAGALGAPRGGLVGLAARGALAVGGGAIGGVAAARAASPVRGTQPRADDGGAGRIARAREALTGAGSAAVGSAARRTRTVRPAKRTGPPPTVAQAPARQPVKRPAATSPPPAAPPSAGPTASARRPGPAAPGDPAPAGSAASVRDAAAAPPPVDAGEPRPAPRRTRRRDGERSV